MCLNLSYRSRWATISSDFPFQVCAAWKLSIDISIMVGIFCLLGDEYSSWWCFCLLLLPCSLAPSMLLIPLLFAICQQHLLSTYIYNITVFYIWNQYSSEKSLKYANSTKLDPCFPNDWVGLEQPWFRVCWLIDQVDQLHQSWFDTLDSSCGNFAC